MRVRSYTTLVGLEASVILSAAGTAKVSVVRINRHRLVAVRNLEISGGDGGIYDHTCSNLIIENNYICHNHGHISLDIPYGRGLGLGRRVTTLVKQKQKGGYKSVIWNAKKAAAGFFFYKLSAGDFSDTKKEVLLK